MPRPRQETTEHKALIVHRRRKVAELMARGIIQKQIRIEVGPNPENGKLWSVGCINIDCKAVLAQWREDSVASIEEHQARLLAQLQEVLREGWKGEGRWKKKDLDKVLRSIEQQAKILGAYAPSKIAADLSGSLEVENAELADARRSLLGDAVQAIASGGEAAALGPIDDSADPSAALRLGLVGKTEAETPAG